MTALANIGPKEQKQRLVIGAATIVMGIGVAVALIFAGLSRWWRVLLFLPFWIGALGLFQAKEKT